MIALLAIGCGNAPPDSATAPLEARCVDPNVAPPGDGLLCGATRTVACTSPNGADPTFVYVPLERTQCTGVTFTVSDRGPFAVGTHEVIVSDAANANDEICRATVVVTDDVEPTYTAHDVALWPPNHKWHRVDTADCVTVEDRCDDDVEVSFLWASSDESVNTNGDGNHEPDIRNLDCDSVEFRAERAGPQNGRVYHLGWRAEDDDGNVVEGICEVRVEHDQSGRRAVDDGEAYRVEAPAECGGGSQQPSPNPTSDTPPSDTPPSDTPPSDTPTDPNDL